MKKKDERRGGADRRKRDVGPPKGWTERRRTVERRIPEIELVEISDTDWAKYFAGAKPVATREFQEPQTVVETAAEVLDRVRD